MNNDMAREKLLNEHEAAALLDCSVHKLRFDRWAGKGITYVKIGKNVRYRDSDIREFISKNAIMPR